MNLFEWFRTCQPAEKEVREKKYTFCSDSFEADVLFWVVDLTHQKNKNCYGGAYYACADVEQGMEPYRVCDFCRK